MVRISSPSDCSALAKGGDASSNTPDAQPMHDREYLEVFGSPASTGGGRGGGGGGNGSSTGTVGSDAAVWSAGLTAEAALNKLLQAARLGGSGQVWECFCVWRKGREFRCKCQQNLRWQLVS